MVKYRFKSVIFREKEHFCHKPFIRTIRTEKLPTKEAGGEVMSGEIYQAQVIRNFFDCITGTDRNLTRIYMCVMSLAKLRMESPEKITILVDQLKKSKIQKELSVDILDYMCDAANQIELHMVQTAFGVKDIREVAQDFSGISMDSL
jgi:hypothetical protein